LNNPASRAGLEEPPPGKQQSSDPPWRLVSRYTVLPVSRTLGTPSTRGAFFEKSP